MKTCLRCQCLFPLSAFNCRTHISKFTGEPAIHYYSYCRECDIQNAKDYRQSKPGLFSIIYSGQLGSSKKRGHPPPDYTKADLIAWLEACPQFDSLYADWVASGYDMWLKPSPDRLDESLPYTLSNLQLVTWGENAASFKQKKVTQGAGECKSVYQYENGILINTFYSIHEASRQSGAAPGNIVKCCQGEYETSKGFVWRYV